MSPNINSPTLPFELPENDFASCAPFPEANDSNNYNKQRKAGPATRRSTSITTAATDNSTDCYVIGLQNDDSSSTIATECHDSMFFSELERYLEEKESQEEAGNDNENPQESGNGPSVAPLLVHMMQERLMRKHLKSRSLRRVVSHNAMSSIQEDVAKVNDAASGNATVGLRTVFSFSDIREHKKIADSFAIAPLADIKEEEEEEAYSKANNDKARSRHNAIFEESILDERQAARTIPSPGSLGVFASAPGNTSPKTATLPPHAKSKEAKIESLATGFAPCLSPPQALKDGIRRSQTVSCTSLSSVSRSASAAGKALLAGPSPSLGIDKPQTGQLRRARTDFAPTDKARAAAFKMSARDFLNILNEKQQQQR